MDNFISFAINHWALFLTLAILLALIFINEAQTARGGSDQLSPQQAVSRINHDNATVFDIRDKERFQEGHIVDAINTKSSDFELPKMEKYKNKAIIIACGNGSQSTQLLAKLKKTGFENPAILKGGMSAWSTAELPVVKHKSVSKKQLKAAKAAKTTKAAND